MRGGFTCYSNLKNFQNQFFLFLYRTLVYASRWNRAVRMYVNGFTVGHELSAGCKINSSDSYYRWPDMKSGNFSFFRKFSLFLLLNTREISIFFPAENDFSRKEPFTFCYQAYSQELVRVLLAEVYLMGLP